MKKIAAVAAGFLFLSIPSFAQERSASELDQMVGPIALYPDPLIAEILSASTFPSQIVEADRYASQGGDPSQVDQQPWDPSVQGLVHYPAVLKWLDDNIAWTTQLGQAFQSQQTDVMDSVQRLRGQAQNLGNLPSTAQETVSDDSGDIEIEPTDPNQMYVPDYQPNVIFEQPGIYCTFGIALPVGVWLGYDWDWHRHRIFAWGPDHPRPNGWFHLGPGERRQYIQQNHPVAWRPGSRSIVMHGGWDRGYAPQTVSRPAPAVPRTPRENIETVREANHPAYRSPTPEPSHNFARPEQAQSRPQTFARPEPAPSRAETFSRPEAPAGGVFGGSQSGSEARQSSSRGGESRATMPAPSRGGGGGSNKR